MAWSIPISFISFLPSLVFFYIIFGIIYYFIFEKSYCVPIFQTNSAIPLLRTTRKFHKITNILNTQLLRVFHCSYGSVCLLLSPPYLLVSFNPLISFCFASKRQGNNSKTAKFFYPPGSTLSISILSDCSFDTCCVNVSFSV